MSKGAGKAEVFRTTKVRTRLRDDGSWLQRRSEPDDEQEEEKPWLAEVRASRVNGAPAETSPVSSPTKPTPPPTNSETQSAPKPGYLIRGVFTKLDKPPTNTPSTNGPSGTKQFTKKPSESYKKIAPYTVKPTLESQESQLSPEEKEKRTEAASNVLKNSAGRQRSYVLSAAKKYETKPEEPDTSSPVNNSLAFVAKRVALTDDDESAATPAPVSSPPPSSVAPVTSVASAPRPKPRPPVDSDVKKAVDAIVNKPVAPKVEKKKAALEPAKEDLYPASVPEKNPFEGMKPGCTKVATPLPVFIPEPKDLKSAVQDETPLVDLTPAAVPLSPTPLSPTPAPAVPLSPIPLSPTPAPAVPLSPTPVSPTPAPAVPLSPTPLSPTPAPAVPLSPTPVSPTPAPAVPLSPTPVSPTPAPAVPLSPTPVSPTPAPAVPLSPTPVSPTPVSPVPFVPIPVSAVREITVNTKPSPKPSSSVDTLSALSDTLISFNTSPSSLKDNEPDLAKEEGGSADTRTAEEGDEEEPTPKISNCIPITDDLLSLTEGSPKESTEPVPPSPGRWSQYLLSGPDSESKPAKSSGTLDLLANDVIIMNTEARSLSMQPEEEKPTDETAKETQSSTETVTVTTKTVISTDKSEEDIADRWSSRVKTTTVTESRSADTFDPYPIGTTSPNSSSDLLQPLADISINRVSRTSTENKDPSEDTSNALESLADDVIPINTEVKSLSTRRSWTRTWDTSTTERTYTEERDKAKPEGQDEYQNMTVMFERKSKENDSPWDRWTSPTVYTTTSDQGDEEEEESLEDTQTQTITTTTTIREIHGEPEPAMDRYDTYSRTVIEEEQRVQTPEPETKKGFVYLKEYVNSSELSLHNARDTADGGSDYLTSRSANYSYSSPPSGSLSSTCNYCGKLVGNDAKISIEHLNVNCHPACFKCAVCDKPMGDLLFSMFLHDGKVHCESCYSSALD